MPCAVSRLETIVILTDELALILKSSITQLVFIGICTYLFL